MEQFKSEPLQIFLYAHTRLNNYIKISTVAVDYLYKSKSDTTELSTLINDLILNAEERWTPRIIKNVNEELTNLKNDLCKTGIIWVYSSFDAFYKQIEGQLSGFFSNPEDNTDLIEDNANGDEKKESKIVNLYRKLNWSLDNIEKILPILKFYETLRHCVAHNMGRPTRKLLDLSQSSEFITSISNWETKYVKKSISTPPVITENKIEIKPHHSIIYSETCLRIATDINQRIFEKYGLQYYVEQTIKKHLLDCNKLTEPVCKDYSRYISFHLKNDFDISISPYKKVLEFTSDERKLKQYKAKYLTLKMSADKGLT